MKDKGKGHPITYHEGRQREQKYGSTLSSTSELDGGEWLRPRPWERPGAHCTGGWVNPKESVYLCHLPTLCSRPQLTCGTTSVPFSDHQDLSQPNQHKLLSPDPRGTAVQVSLSSPIATSRHTPCSLKAIFWLYTINKLLWSTQVNDIDLPSVGKVHLSGKM
jgi:hypothetical protein